MQTPRRTRSSVLGKRSHQASADESFTSVSTDKPDDEGVLPTPESTPKLKRARTMVLEDGAGNKENIPPFRTQSLVELSPSSGRAIRSIRRTNSYSPRMPSTPRKRCIATMPPSTPSTAFSGLSLASPPITPPSFLPLSSRVRALLRATCNSSAQIAGRSHERELVLKFLSSFIAGEEAAGQPSTLYISGLPGTGKTALVNDVLRGMATQDARIVTVNCMALTGMDNLWDRLQEELSDLVTHKGRGCPKKLKAKEAVDQILSTSTTKCVIILDELDHIAKSPQSLTALFTLAQDHSASARFVGIANTHTLTSSTSALGDRADVQTVHFGAYTAVQLLEIIQLRLASLSQGEMDASIMKKFLPVPALTLLSKKIASQTGDVRAVFEVLRGAIDLAVVTAKASDDKDADPVVTPAHVLAAHKAYAPAAAPMTRTMSAPALVTSGMSPMATGGSALASTVRGLGLQARLALLSVVLASKRVDSGLSLGPSPSAKPAIKRAASQGGSSSVAIDSAQLHAYYAAALTRSESDVFTPVSRSEFADLLGMLETVGLVSLASPAGNAASPTKGGARKPIARSLSFGGAGKGKSVGARAQEVRLAQGVRVEEMLRGLGVQAAPEGADVDIREEEVRAVWSRERARIAREIKNLAIEVSGDVFVDAMED